MLNSKKNLIKSFFLRHKSNMMRKELNIMNRVIAGLSYNVSWGISVLLISLFIFHLIGNTKNEYLPIVGIFVVVYLIAVVIAIKNSAWKLVVHSYCFLSMALLIVESFCNTNCNESAIMLYAMICILLSFNLVGLVYGGVYAGISVLVVLVYLIKHIGVYELPSETFNVFSIIFTVFMILLVAYICFHFIRIMYSVLAKMENTINREKILGDKLLQMTESAKLSAKEKEEFLSTMSHELRSPLNSVIGFAQLLEEEGLPNKQLEALQYLQFSADNLLMLINDVLDYHKFDSGNLFLEKSAFSFNEVFFCENSQFQQKLKKDEFNILFRVDPLVATHYYLGDALRIQQLVYNILINIAFTQKSLSLEITQVAECIQFEFRYLGLNKMLANIVENEFRADKLFINGNGESMLYLRLAIAIRLIEALNSKFEYVYSESVNVSRVAFKLALPKVINETQKDIAQKTDFSKLNVLVVDDNELNVILLSKLLSKFQMKVDTASDGRKAIEKVATHSFDIVFMDINMPIINGYEASKIIKTNTQNVKIIALTGEQKNTVQMKMDHSQIDGIVTKPIEIKLLINEIERVLL